MVVNFKIKDKNVKENRNKKFLILFTIYQMLELLFLFLYVLFFCLKFFGANHSFDINGIFNAFRLFITGIVIQYFIVLLFWLNGNKYYRKVKITTYCCLDLIPIFRNGLIFYFFMDSKSWLSLLLTFLFFVFLSKIIFFNFVANKYEDL